VIEGGPTPDADRPGAIASRMLSPARLAMQIVGFAGGTALIGWCAWKAFSSADWQVLREASPAPIALIIGCSFVSLLLNGAIFWAGGRPLARLGLMEMEAVNAMASVLNYAPVRLGAIARVAYALRVSRMRIPAAAAWFVWVTAGVGIWAVAGASVAWLFPETPWFIAASWLVVGLLGFWIAAILTRRLLGARSESLRLLATDPASLWGAASLRFLEQAMWIGRMHAAVLILDLPIDLADSIVLALVGILVSLNPLGRFGYREVAVAWLASTLADGTLDPTQIDAVFFQLALIESVGEAIVMIPLGTVGSIWCLRRLLGRRGATSSGG